MQKASSNSEYNRRVRNKEKVIFGSLLLLLLEEDGMIVSFALELFISTLLLLHLLLIFNINE